MRIKELFEYMDVEQSLQQELEDIILRARKGNISMLDIDDVIGELNMSIDGFYLDMRDEEGKQKIIDILRSGDWVEQVLPNGKIKIKHPGSIPHDDTEVGDEAQKSEDERKRKAQKIAMKNVKAND